jgi:serine/threonine-protein kinase RsbW
MNQERELTDDSSRSSAALRLLPWAKWAAALPPTAHKAVSDVDFTKPYVYVSVPGLAQRLSIVRTELRRWTAAADLGVELAQDIVLAVNEAAANAIEHVYRTPRERPTTVVVFAGQVQPGGMVYVVVSDHGRWQPPSIEDSIRGRGISMMKALADRFALHHDETGTTVLLGWLL